METLLMERIVALVEGHTESHFIKLTYGAAIVIRPFPNGRNVDVSQIVDSISDALETIGGSINKVVIMLDREKRELSASDVAMAIAAGLSPVLNQRSLYIGVSDRHIENWILADEKNVKSEFNQSSYVYCGDGVFGKPLLEDLSPELKSPRDKAVLLKSTSATTAAVKSPSLAAFIRQIDFPWPWATS